MPGGGQNKERAEKGRLTCASEGVAQGAAVAVSRLALDGEVHLKLVEVGRGQIAGGWLLVGALAAFVILLLEALG